MQLASLTFAVSQFRVCILQRPHLKANNITAVPIRRLLLLFPLFGGCTATILRGLPDSKILCNIAWRRLSLSQPWVTEIVTPPKAAKARSFKGRSPWIGIQPMLAPEGREGGGDQRQHCGAQVWAGEAWQVRGVRGKADKYQILSVTSWRTNSCYETGRAGASWLAC